MLSELIKIAIKIFRKLNFTYFSLCKIASHDSYNLSSIVNKLAIVLEEYKSFKQLLVKEYAKQIYDKDLIIQQANILNDIIQQDYSNIEREISKLCYNINKTFKKVKLIEDELNSEIKKSEKLLMKTQREINFS